MPMPASHHRSHRALRPAGLALGLLLAAPGLAAAAAAPAPASPRSSLEESRIVAVVNGDVISNTDVDNRARLFAMSTGLPMSSEVVDRLKPQITRQLVDERLRMQEVQRRHIVIPDQQIAAAIREIETRNGLPAGALRERLKRAGVSPLTLIDQIRTQLGWTQVLREQLAEKATVTDAEVAERQRLLKQEVGKTEYRVGEIFIPVEDPANTADAQRFAETVITELRRGAPFALVAAQFSQNQSALEGGELGWVQANQLDPEVVKLLNEMPAGAISNPIKVPGGFSIATLQGKRQIGHDLATVLSLRQVFLPFPTTLNPEAPTPQQRAVLDKARSISTSVHSCEQMEQVAKDNNSTRPADPGDVRLESVNPPAFRAMLAALPVGKATQPLVSTDGISVMLICSRDQKNMAETTPQQVRGQILGERVELTSRQLLRSLRRAAHIDIRTSGA
jgi:peptidyl-prolyl cis-trans isomerase SurA